MNKCSNQSVIAPLTPIQTTRPFEIITTDIMGPLEVTAQDNKYILVVCDHFTKWVELFAIKSLSAEEAADKLMQVIYRHSAPEAILSDQGTNFQSNLLSELWELLDVHKLRTTPYHPQCDGLTERFNRTLQPMIAAYLNERKDDWDDKLAALQFAYNTSVHATTNCSPFELVYGRIPKLPIDLIFDNLQLHTE
jgi:transposase InsO family protein